MTWKTIDDAPKNIVHEAGDDKYGPFILAWPMHCGVARAQWWEGPKLEPYREETSGFLNDDGFLEHPTHWMPLPLPPSDETQA